MTDLRAITIQPPYDGIDSDSAPDAIEPTKGHVVANFLVDRPGQLPIRGPLNETTVILSSSSGEKPVGVWPFNDKLLVGYRAPSATAKRDPWVAPYRKAALAADLSAALTGANALKVIDLAASPVTVSSLTPTDASRVPGPRYTRLGAHVYGVSFDTTTAAVNENGGFRKLTSILRWDGAVEPVVHVNAPRGAQDIRAHYQRLFVLGGRNPDGTGQIANNTLWYSDPIAGTTPLPDTLAAWQDDTSGLVNQIVVDSDQSDDFGAALARVGQSLVIFKRRSIHVLHGHSPSTFQVRPFTLEQGCIDPRSIVEYEDGCLFMSDQGFMWFDGSQLVNMTPLQRSSIVAAAVEHVGDAGVDGGRCVAGRLPNSYIALSIGRSSSTSNPDSSTTSFCGMLHVPRRAWATLSSDVLTGRYAISFGRSSTKTYVLDDRRIVLANKITAPEQTSSSTRGYDVTEGGVPLIIPAELRTRLAPLSSPLHRSQLHRFLFDYTFERSIGGEFDAWQVQLSDGEGSNLGVYRVRSQTAASKRRRHVRDVFAEANDVQVVVTLPDDGVTGGLVRASILPMTVEFQATRQRRTE